MLSALFLVGACSEVKPDEPMKSKLATFIASQNFNPRLPRMIIVHHTNMQSFADALQILRDDQRQGQVSAHYLIGRDGYIAQLVADDQRAWHAGISNWAGQSDINSLSLGIELDNDGASPFPEVQMQALIGLLSELTTRLKIAPTEIWAHADIAPTRKNDPSSYFPWKQLADAGFGRWPAPTGLNIADPWQALGDLGYDLTDKIAARRAFRRHYRGPEFLLKQQEAIARDSQSTFDTNAYTVWGEDWDATDISILRGLQR
jgi:N-acetylmuramoyl-L-alanine amidase